ncbi:hypothetical protein B4N89_27840 [Embleya scabrispora]|uniref:DNA primase/polymerase bifunctional N-terminal domain-containing protein n=1 Tax=Embleya scabrispora TaxID=159449 RepID=A0A1T3P5L7_9ACTN|nr:bifunctional DNA primase/polymerase [Embleya scabrispora]OPC84235.1 hypothetical protein B4N89_27840 [Embleya scabrispora]
MSLASTACVQCGGPLPTMHRADRKHCSRSCEARAYRARKQAKAAAERAAGVRHVPAVLRERARWVRHVAKRPMRTDGRWASTTDPSTWSDFDTAYRSTVGEGIGYVLATGDDVLVVDLDDALEQGELLPWAQRIVDALPATYMDRGRSGNGLHLWFRGKVPAGRRIRRRGVAIEWYSDRRYIIVGDRVPDAPLQLADLPNAAAILTALL